MTTTPLALRLARNRVLTRARANPDNTAPVLARHMPLLDLFPWKKTHDREECEDIATTAQDDLEIQTLGLQAKTALKKAGLWDAAKNIFAKAHPLITWRFSDQSPDNMHFNADVAHALLYFRPTFSKDGQYYAIDESFNCPPSSTLGDIGDAVVWFGDAIDDVAGIVHDLEYDRFRDIIQSEVLLACPPHIAPDMRDPRVLDILNYTYWALHRTEMIPTGRWVGRIWNKRLTKILKDHGDQNGALGMQSAMHAADMVVRDMASIPGKTIISLWDKDTNMTLKVLQEDGRFAGTAGNTHDALDRLVRSILIRLMMDTGIVLIERALPLSIGGVDRFETYTAQLQDGQHLGLSAGETRMAFTVDMKTGQNMPKDEGRLYRDWPGLV